MTTPHLESAGSFDRRVLLGAAGLASVAALASARAGAGPLNPPAGAVAPTGKTLAEIEPRTAISAANTPGDANSLYKIIQPGSYYLTGNIQVTTAGFAAIEIAAPGVTVDLNGFEVLGMGAAGGSVSAITAATSTYTGAQVLGGTVRNWGGAGVDLSTSASVRNMSVINCGLASSRTAIYLGIGCAIENCVVNGGGVVGGFGFGSQCTARGCTALNTGGAGFSTNGACVFHGCTSNGCGYGFALSEGDVAIGCAASFNNGDGFILTAALAADCIAHDNEDAGFFLNSVSHAQGCFSHRNTYGFQAFNGAVVLNNNASSNTTAGFYNSSGGEVRFEGNSARSNPTGFLINTSGNLLIRNTAARSSTANWNVVGGNFCLVVAAVGGLGAINGDSGGVSPGSTNPYANFSL
ncbi:MAG: hypothetical protein QM783_10820 [Phycisphaerales bacterium]